MINYMLLTQMQLVAIEYIVPKYDTLGLEYALRAWESIWFDWPDAWFGGFVIAAAQIHVGINVEIRD